MTATITASPIKTIAALSSIFLFLGRRVGPVKCSTFMQDVDVDRGLSRTLNRGLPSDRYLRGLVKGFSVSENLILGQHWIRPYSNRGVFAQSAVVQHAKELVNEYRIHTPGIDTPAGSLSGGNAQRLIMARELSSDPRVILACQPTRGLDVGATEYVRNQLLRQRNEGAAVLLISADLEEIMILSDRILVLFEGEIVGTLSSDEADVELLGHMMAGSRPDMPSAPGGQSGPVPEAGDASA